MSSGSRSRSTPNTPTVPGARPATPTRSSTRSPAGRLRATFFVQGRWAEAYPATARAHRIGGSPDRPPLPLPRADAAAPGRRLRRRSARRRRRDRDGHRRRPPAVVPLPVRRGRGRPPGARRDRAPRLPQRRTGTSTLEDWEPWRTGEAISADAIDGVRAHGDGAVVLLHTWPGGTAEAHRSDDRRAARARGNVRHGRRRSRSCRESVPRCWRSTAAARRSTSHSCAATARSWAPLASPARSAIERGRRGGHLEDAELVRVDAAIDQAAERAGSIRLAVPSPMSGSSASPARTCPPTTGGSSPGCARTAGRRSRRRAQRHVRRAPGRDRPVVGGRRRLRVRHELLPASRRTAASRGSPRSGRSPATGAVRTSSAAKRSGTRSAPRTAADRRRPSNASCRASSGSARPSQLMEAIYFERVREERLAELAPLVFRRPPGGDAVAQDLVDRQADEVVAMATTAIRRLRMRDARRRRRSRRRRLPQRRRPILRPDRRRARRPARRRRGPAARRRRPIVGAALIGLDAPRARRRRGDDARLRARA